MSSPEGSYSRRLATRETAQQGWGHNYVRLVSGGSSMIRIDFLVLKLRAGTLFQDLTQTEKH